MASSFKRCRLAAVASVVPLAAVASVAWPADVADEIERVNLDVDQKLEALAAYAASSNSAQLVVLVDRLVAALGRVDPIASKIVSDNC